jgi:hypothetical protein
MLESNPSARSMAGNNREFLQLRDAPGPHINRLFLAQKR